MPHTFDSVAFIDASLGLHKDAIILLKLFAYPVIGLLIVLCLNIVIIIIIIIIINQ